MTAPLDDLPALEDTPFKIEAAEDLLSLPDPDWLVNGIIQRNTLALIYGPSGCGKSFLALDLAHHLALQRAWFSHEVDKRAGVLYVAAEASGGIVKRVKAFRQHHQLAESTYCPLWFIRSPVDLLAPKTVDDIEITSAAWANLDLSEAVSNGASDLGTGAAAGEPSKKSIGRPKGYPKSGGRTKDSPAPSETKNDTPPPGLPPRELRRWLAEKSDYYNFMAKMCAGKPIRQRGPTGKQTNEWYYPSVADRKWAAAEIGKKCLPDLSATQLTGEDGKPIKTETTNVVTHDDRELARRLSLALAKGTQPLQDSPDEGGESLDTPGSGYAALEAPEESEEAVEPALAGHLNQQEQQPAAVALPRVEHGYAHR